MIFIINNWIFSILTELRNISNFLSKDTEWVIPPFEAIFNFYKKQRDICSENVPFP